jgi:putative transposase
MNRAYKYRIYPTPAQVTRFEQTLDICCELYNAALQERRDVWRIARKSVSCYDQIKQLPELKRIREDLKSVHSQVLYDPLARLDKAFNGFFRRVKADKKKVGFPRFRSRLRYNSFTFSQLGFSVRLNKLQLSKIGMIKIKLHRPVEGKIKTLTVTKSATGKWYACFTAEVEAVPLGPNNTAVGIDAGLEKFATLSTGESIENPRFFRKGEKVLAKAQKRASEVQRGSVEYKKRRKVVARLHEKIANRRRNFAHQLSRTLINRFGMIVFENLNIAGMVKNHCLAKSISDAAWNQLIQFTAYKAEWAGRKVVLVNPRNTSRMCSGCKEMVDKTLSDRVHACPCCGLTIDRDENASINILSLGLQALGASLESLAM